MYRDTITFSNTEVIQYLRKSRSDDPLLSVEEVLAKHEKILADYAERNLGGIIPEENIYREIASSETIDGRPEMLKLLSAIESPKIKAILVVEVQRLSRGDLEDAGRLMKLLRYTNTMIITPQKTYDLQDEYDRDIFERELKRGNEYLEYYKKIQKRGRLLSVQEGNFVGSVPPYGYDKTYVMDGKRKCPTLIENKEQADVVRMIFDLYVNHSIGTTAICNRLDELGIKPLRIAHWSSSTIESILDNVHYIGKVKWDSRKTVTVVDNGEIVKTRPRAEQFSVYDGKHAAIIPESLFLAAQSKRGKNPRTKTSTTIRNPFAALLFCRCGRAMSLRTYKSNGIEKSAPRLICDNQTHCQTGSCLYSEMMDRVCSILREYIADFEFQLQNEDKNAVKLHQNLIANMEKKWKDLEEKEIRQWEKYSEEGMPKAIFDKLNEKVIHEKQELRQALDKAYAAAPVSIDYKEKITRFSEALSAMEDPDISAELKNQYLKSVFERIEYYREKPVRTSKKDIPILHTEQTEPAHKWYSPPFELDIQSKV